MIICTFNIFVGLLVHRWLRKSHFHQLIINICVCDAFYYIYWRTHSFIIALLPLSFQVICDALGVSLISTSPKKASAATTVDAWCTYVCAYVILRVSALLAYITNVSTSSSFFLKNMLQRSMSLRSWGVVLFLFLSSMAVLIRSSCACLLWLLLFGLTLPLLSIICAIIRRSFYKPFAWWLTAFVLSCVNPLWRSEYRTFQKSNFCLVLSAVFRGHGC